MLVFDVLMAIAAYGAVFTLFTSVIALSVFIVWLGLRRLARRTGLADE